MADLKNELLDGTFQKYFNEYFEKKDFQNKWMDFYNIRNKIAHTSYFVASELNDCKRLYEELKEIIDNAYSKIDNLQLSAGDKEALIKVVTENNKQENQENQYINNNESLDSRNVEKNNQRDAIVDVSHGSQIINEKVFMQELNRAANSLPYVGLKHFVTVILSEKGYSITSSYALINYLIDKGDITTEKIDNPLGGYPIAVINIVKDK